MSLVAPFAGAWIEINVVRFTRHHTAVAPFAGAWIEIYPLYRSTLCTSSLRSPERGLKFLLVSTFCDSTKSLRSPERGLKFTGIGDNAALMVSLRSPERGLKYDRAVKDIEEISVAPFAGAWIEINFFIFLTSVYFVAPFAGAWIEISVFRTAWKY